MIIQFVLSFIFLVLFAYGIHEKNKSKGIGLIIYGCSVAGGFFVWFPEYTGDIARFAGVGRGADLVLYLSVVIGFAVAFTLYLKIYSCMKMLTELVRQAALNSPTYPEQARPDR